MIQLLRSIDAQRAAALLEEAHALIGPGTRWGDESNFLTAVNSMPEELRKRVGDLERDLYSDLDDLHRLVFDYLSKHREEIDAPPDFWTESVKQ
jgi:hypothetical protein